MRIERTRIWAGEIVRIASREGAALGEIAAEHAARAFGCTAVDLPKLHDVWEPNDAWVRTCEARQALTADSQAFFAAIDLAEALGFDRKTLRVDRPRLRVVEPHAHNHGAAARAFYTHRDTWYGCPRAQVNVWIPLFDVDERDSFGIYTAAFDAAVDNDSANFDYTAFAQHGGFQSQRLVESTYPRCLGAPPGEPFRVRARAGEAVAFSAAHLHATTPNETNRTRMSVDVRFVDLVDHERGLGAPDVDNHSRGTALVDYARASA